VETAVCDEHLLGTREWTILAGDECQCRVVGSSVLASVGDIYLERHEWTKIEELLLGAECRKLGCDECARLGLELDIGRE